MICECCKSSIDDHATFCMYCGNGMTKICCPNCSALLPEIAKYCSECGTNIYDFQPLDFTPETSDFEEDEYEDEEYEDEEYEDEERIVPTVPTLNNYKDLGFLTPNGYGYTENFRIAWPYSDDTYLGVYDDWCSSYEKCNLHNLISYKIVEDGIFYATRTEAVFLHKSGLHFNVNIKNICGIEFENDILTVTYIASHRPNELHEFMLEIIVAKTQYDYNYINNNLHF